MSRNQKIISLTVILIVIIAIVTGAFLHSQSHGQQEATKNTSSKTVNKKKQVNYLGKWSGKRIYKGRGTVTLTVSLNKGNTYKLIEANTVSQTWKRSYTGNYSKKENNIVATPNSVDVTTYADATAMKNGNATATEQVDKADMYHQFGNQQTSKIKINANGTLTISHDHEKITLKSDK